MRFPLKKKEIYKASLLGFLTGLLGVVIFIVLLNVMGQNVEKVDEERVPVSATEDLKEGTYEQFFAAQHGVFSSFESASDFVSKNKELNTSAIIEIDGQYYVWSSVAIKKEDVPNNGGKFVKPFNFSGAACDKKTLQNLPIVLKDNEKINFEENNKKASYPADWTSITSALSSLSKDTSIMRMHLIAHYYSKNDCLKIEF